jgi:predicted esterase
LLRLAGAATTLGWPAATLAASGYEMRDITVSGDKTIGRRFTLLVPKHADRPVPLLVTLHGLGETGDEKLGAWAWHDRYGLGTSYDRLLSPPIARVDQRVKHWDADRLASVNAELARKPFGGLAVACPYTPNVHKAASREKAFDAYVEWLATEVIPRARKETSILEGARHTGLDGCSLGGYIGIEIYLRKPELFHAWGSVQGAFGSHRVPTYADRLRDLKQRFGARPIHLETSSTDTFREVNEQLSKALRDRGVDHDFIMPPGPHNQPFLRDSGTLEMLLWHDRALR